MWEFSKMILEQVRENRQWNAAVQEGQSGRSAQQEAQRQVNEKIARERRKHFDLSHTEVRKDSYTMSKPVFSCIPEGVEIIDAEFIDL